MRPSPASPHVDALTGLRGVAALWVVFFHLGPELFTAFPALTVLEPLSATGYLGVDLFFGLSGYVLARRYRDGVRDIGRYFLRRVARIFPLHLAVLFALTLGATIAGPLGCDGFANHALWRGDAWWSQVFLVQAWVDSPEAWNVPTWSLSCEWAGYLALPWVLPHHLDRRRASLAATLLLLGGLVLGVHHYGHWDLTLDGGLWRFAVDFGAGALAWHAVPSTASLRRGYADAIAVALPTLSFLAPDPRLMVPLLVLWPMALAHSDGPVARWLARPSLGGIGRASFALYLVHEVVALVLNSLWPVASLQSTTARLGWLAAILVGITGATLVGYLCVERPAHRWLVRRPSALPQEARS